MLFLYLSFESPFTLIGFWGFFEPVVFLCWFVCVLEKYLQEAKIFNGH